jgi:hypothetical protein
MGMDGMLNLGLHEWKVTRLMFSIWLILLLVVLFCVARVFVDNQFVFVVTVTFQSDFCLETYWMFFCFLKFIFNIIISKWSKNINKII